MLFVTNRIPDEGIETVIGRKVSFNPQNTTASQHVFFCKRKGENEYEETGKVEFFKQLKQNKKQILLFIHGFNNPMESGAFEKAINLQKLINKNQNSEKKQVHIVPLIWPCDEDGVLAMLDDYHDDRSTAKVSDIAFARVIGKFDTWRRQQKRGKECYLRINILAHSMGNLVLRGALKYWADNFSPKKQVPQLFRNVFMVAPDLVNHTLEKDEEGEYIPQSARNVVVYHANDDYAMPASKVANIFNSGLSRRLGMTGPENMSKVSNNVYKVDCDNFNNTFDPPTGHTYFLGRDGDLSKSSPIIKHMIIALETGRVQPPDRFQLL